MEFNPNKPGITKEFFWATYIPNRRPKFKLHSNRGHALNAVKYEIRHDSILYKWSSLEREWIECFRLENYTKPSTCDQCGISLIDPKYSWSTGSMRWVDKDLRPQLICVCKTCAKEIK